MLLALHIQRPAYAVAAWAYLHLCIAAVSLPGLGEQCLAMAAYHEVSRSACTGAIMIQALLQEEVHTAMLWRSIMCWAWAPYWYCWCTHLHIRSECACLATELKSKLKISGGEDAGSVFSSILLWSAALCLPKEPFMLPRWEGDPGAGVFCLWLVQSAGKTSHTYLYICTPSCTHSCMSARWS